MEIVRMRERQHNLLAIWIGGIRIFGRYLKASQHRIAIQRDVGHVEIAVLAIAGMESNVVQPLPHNNSLDLLRNIQELRSMSGALIDKLNVSSQFGHE